MVSICRSNLLFLSYNLTVKALRFKKLLSEGAYDGEHYFVAQMYENEWKPSLSVE